MRDRYPSQLSGGQRQRVGVARALAADPPLMLMDEPFGAIDPINRERLQDEFLRLQGELRKTIVFVTHDIDEAIKMGDKIAILREGGHLAQYASPEEILARPADEFVARFVGADRGLKRLALTKLGDLQLDQLNGHRPGLQLPAAMSVRDGLSAMLAADGSDAVVVQDERELGIASVDRRRPAAQRGEVTSPSRRGVRSSPTSAAAPSSCVRENKSFCWNWVQAELERHAVPGAAPARRADAHRGRHRLRHRVRAGPGRPPPRLGRAPVTIVTGVLYTIPSLALFQLLVPITGLIAPDGRDRAGLLHAADPLPQHARRAARRARRRARGRRRAWG